MLFQVVSHMEGEQEKGVFRLLMICFLIHPMSNDLNLLLENNTLLLVWCRTYMN